MQFAATSRETTVRARSHTWARWIRLFLGLWLFASGLALMVRASLGLSSWDVLHDGVAELSALSFGFAVVVVSGAVLVISAMLGIKPGPGTVANMLLIGLFTDALLATGTLQGLHTGGVLARGFALVTGVAAIAFGTALYIGAGLGAGPRDSLMLAVARRLGTTPGTARTLLELSILIVGVLLGGDAGIGTLLFALLIGPAIDVSYALLGMHNAGHTRPRTLKRVMVAMTAWLRRGQLGSSDELEIARHTGVRG
jgi:uncharacterized protein